MLGALYACIYVAMIKPLNKPFKITFVLLFATAIAACGQRGPLYIPEEAPANEPNSSVESSSSNVTNESLNGNDPTLLQATRSNSSNSNEQQPLEVDMLAVERK
jgi:predicted small lipoprotein YifL